MLIKAMPFSVNGQDSYVKIRGIICEEIEDKNVYY
jgi:hypothetical protein